jgi:hypothetical protein
MRAILDPRLFGLVVVLPASALIAFLAPKGKAAMAGAGTMVAFLGILYLASGRIIQRWGGGPPLEGSLATLGSLFMIAFGACIVLVAFFKRPDDPTKRDDI